MEEIHCTYIKILSEEESQFIIGLFNTIEKKSPNGRLLALIEKQCDKDCPYRFSWGYDKYCDNQHRIEEIKK